MVYYKSNSDWKMKCLIVDDEPLARDLLEDNIRQVPFLDLAGVCSNALEALDIIHREKIDLIFLDIQMPGLNGIQFLQTLKQPALVVFITAYEKFAIEGYNLDVVDYLLKPVAFDRFLKAANKAQELFSLRSKPVSPEFIFVHADYNLVKISFNDVIYVEGLKDYVKIHLSTSQRPVITRMSMKSLEELLPFKKFMRIHKSFILSIEKIISIRKGRVKIAAAELPISDSYAERFYQLIGKPEN
jgi:DNA-binding LytR/AlgR family response regulator